MAYANGVKFIAASSGTGDFVVSAAALGFQTPADASVPNGFSGSYRAESSDLSQWEYGTTVLTITGGTTYTFTRVVVRNSLGTTAKINFVAAPQVLLSASAEDLANASNLTAGTVAPARLGSGGAGAGAKFLADNSTFQTLTNSGVHSIVIYTGTQTITIPTGVTRAYVEMVAPGGGSRGVSSADNGYGSVAVTGSALTKYLTGLTGGNTLSYTEGAAGAAGTSSSNGGNGGNSTLASGTQTISTLTVYGGLGSTNGTIGNTSTPTGGDINLPGVSPGFFVAGRLFSVGVTPPLGSIPKDPPLPLGTSNNTAISSGTNTTGSSGFGYGSVAGFGYSSNSNINGVAGQPGALRITWLY